MKIPIITTQEISYFVVDGLLLSAQQDGSSAKYAVTMDIVRGLAERKQFSAIAQLYGLVIPSLILSAHLFQGLNRYLYCDGVANGDDDKFVFSRKPAYDFFWEGGRTGKEVKRLAPSGQAFVIVLSKNVKHFDKYPDVAGWIDHWNWVDEDQVLNEAPINWVDRYKNKIWSK